MMPRNLRKESCRDHLRPCPGPLAPLAAPLPVIPARWGRAPRAYIHTEEDRAVPPAALKEMVEAIGGAGAERSVRTGHFPMLAEPGQPAAVITDLSN
jgi:pimeloyl-ACP methyl ester carboxylesterase